MKLSELSRLDLTPRRCGSGRIAGTKKEKHLLSAKHKECRRLIDRHKLVYSEAEGLLATIATGTYQKGMPHGSIYVDIAVREPTVQEVQAGWIAMFYPEIV